MSGPEILNSATHGDHTLTKTFDGDLMKNIKEYGYGFWLRYLTQFPEPTYGR